MSVTVSAVDDASQYLDAHQASRQVNRVLHSFPSPRLWNPGVVNVPSLMSRRKEWNAEQQAPAPLELYVGVPYCIRTDPDRCGYCLFPVEVFQGSGQLDVYLNYLEREGNLFREYFEGVTPQTVYIGGGTPNLMKESQYTRMMQILRSVFPGLNSAVNVTLEGIPQLFTREKLEAMQAGGVNRISMGVQQFNDELNQLSGRRQTAQHVFDTIAWCHELNMPCNADLIFGWPRQTMETMLADLEQLVATGVEHIAHYELNIGGPTDFSLNRREELPSPELTKEMYRAARDFLVGQGYRQLTVYDFQKIRDEHEFRYEECWRGFERKELWGWGFAGVSDFGGNSNHAGWSYVNYRNVPEYFASLDRGEPPIERAFAREQIDLRLNALFRNLQGMRVNRKGYADRFGIDPVEEFASAWRAIVDRGWAEIDDEWIRLIDDGVYYTPLIQTLLAKDRVEQLQALACEVALSVQ